MVYSSRQSILVIDPRVKTFSTRKMHIRVHASVWLAARLFASLQRIAYYHGLKWTCTKTGTD